MHNFGKLIPPPYFVCPPSYFGIPQKFVYTLKSQCCKSNFENGDKGMMLKIYGSPEGWLLNNSKKTINPTQLNKI